MLAHEGAGGEILPSDTCIRMEFSQLSIPEKK
jgi:hypothetical protein